MNCWNKSMFYKIKSELYHGYALNEIIFKEIKENDSYE